MGRESYPNLRGIENMNSRIETSSSERLNSKYCDRTLNLKVAKLFRQYADILAIISDNPYRVRAYRRAADSIERLDRSVALMSDDELLKLDGIGKSILAKIRQIIDSGTFREYQEAMRKLPISLLELQEVEGLGPKLVWRLYEELGISTLDELERACLDGRILKVKGIGEKLRAKLLKSLSEVRRRYSRKPLWEALEIFELVRSTLTFHFNFEDILPVGEVRRALPVVSELWIAVSMPRACSDDLSLPLGLAKSVLSETLLGLEFLQVEELNCLRILKFRLTDGFNVNIVICPTSIWEMCLLFYTGPEEHIEMLKRLALRNHYSLEVTGLRTSDGKVSALTEEEIYFKLGFQYIPPELRDWELALSLASENAMPKLLELSDIRGDLHIHTNWSDGRDSVEDMVKMAEKLGYEYIAVTDHSRSLEIASGLTVDSLNKQCKLIRKLNKESSIRVLPGNEVDILLDGTLDYPDEVLRELDWVVAAVHTNMRISLDKMTQRVITAISNPYVDVLAHPRGRLLITRQPYEIELDEVVSKAVQLGVAVELNANPKRLDLDGDILRRYFRTELKVAIGTDAHSTEQMSFMVYGVAQARRGGLSREQVLNTWSIDKIMDWRRKRLSGSLLT